VGTAWEGWLDYYRLPYRLTKPRSVLILGGGSGNDATAALAFGAERVDVVEIDPVILSLGYAVHPHRPYRDPRVHAINDDARAFLRRGSERYDLVVMNALDSHRQLHGLSTLRLESYVYTTGAFRDVKERLNPGGRFIVELTTSREWMGPRLYWSLAEAFGHEPRLYWTGPHGMISVAFVMGQGELETPEPPVEVVPPDVLESMRGTRETTPLATDDWPHLYLSAPRIPQLYQGVLLGVVLFAALLLATLARPAGLQSSLHFLLLGAGFMLLETRSITKMALVFGATWAVNAIVIGFILAVVFAANLLVQRGRAPGYLASAALLGLLLVAGYLLPVEPLLALSLPARLVLGGIWVALPVLFASLLFSRSFEATARPAAAFGANLLGVVLGGVVEYSSMVLGLNALYLVALALYGFAVLTRGGSTAS
jgi:SAM-dependent methyltransferase